MSAEKLPCSKCENPTAVIQNGALIIRSRHHGKVHENVYSIEWLKKKLDESEAKSDTIGKE